MGKTRWSQDAIEDLHRVPDADVIAEIMDLAETELRDAITLTSIDGPVTDIDGMWWRRAVRFAHVYRFESFRLDDADEFHCVADHYVLVYRRFTVNGR